MQVGFMMQKALGELFILKSTKPLPIIFKPSFVVFDIRALSSALSVRVPGCQNNK